MSWDESEENGSASPQRTRALERTDTDSGMTIPRSPFCLLLLGSWAHGGHCGNSLLEPAFHIVLLKDHLGLLPRLVFLYYAFVIVLT